MLQNIAQPVAAVRHVHRHPNTPAFANPNSTAIVAGALGSITATRSPACSPRARNKPATASEDKCSHPN